MPYADPEQRRRYCRWWNKTNAERHAALQFAYRMRDPERARAIKRASYARKTLGPACGVVSGIIRANLGSRGWYGSEVDMARYLLWN